MSDEVSRETQRGETVSLTPSVPDVARRVFTSDDALAGAVRYAELLATEGVVRGLIGPREVSRIWDRHVMNSAVLAQAISVGASVCDIGTGAGLPGLVVAIARPDLSITLVEPLLRRTTFLEEVVAELDLGHVEVLRGRAETLHGERTFDVVTSRAVAPLGRLLEWSMPLVGPTGALVAMKGQSVEEEITSCAAMLTTYRCAPPEVLSLGEGIVHPPMRAVRVAWADPARVGWPLPPAPRRRSRSRRARAT